MWYYTATIIPWSLVELRATTSAERNRLVRQQSVASNFYTVATHSEKIRVQAGEGSWWKYISGTQEYRRINAD